jgi:hypothetical protein
MLLQEKEDLKIKTGKMMKYASISCAAFALQNYLSTRERTLVSVINFTMNLFVRHTKTVGKNLNWDTRRISWSTYRASYADLRGDLSGATSDWTPVLRPRTSG